MDLTEKVANAIVGVACVGVEQSKDLPPSYDEFYQRIARAAIAVCVEEMLRLALERREKEKASGFGPETATPAANLFWCEEIAAAIRSMGEKGE